MPEVVATGERRGGIGLAAERVGHGPDVLATTASDHVALRTPTRPGHLAGNALHLYEPPTAVRPWLDRHDRTVGVVPGVERAVLCWEVDADLTGTDPRAACPADLPDDADVDLVSVWRWRPDLDGDLAARRAALASPGVRDPDDLDVRSGADERVLAGARALYLQGGWGTDVAHWRWVVAQQLDLMVARRAAIWVAYVGGIPACRVSLLHDRVGLAIVDDLVTHPLHRGKGLASAVVVHALRQHLAAFPDHSVVVRTPAARDARGLCDRLGFVTVGTDVSVVRATRPTA